MRIAIVASDYAPSVGGVQTAVRNIAHFATCLGHTVEILSSQPSSRVPKRELVDGIVVHRFPWGRRPLTTSIWRGFKTLVGMRRVLMRFKPDLVYVHFLSINALYVLFLHYLMHFRLVVSARGNDIQGIPLRSSIQRWMLRRLFKRADAILFCSSYLRAAAEPFLRDIPARTFVGVVGDGYDPAEFMPNQSRPFQYPAPFLLGMGRLVEKKGFDLLIRAFAQVAPEFPQVHLLIAGDGEERPRLEQCIAEVGSGDRIRLLGMTDRQTTISLFLGCEFFVLSSRIEPFGIVVLEAMAANKPVLATRSGGVVDLIRPGTNGLLVDANEDSLAEGIRQMLLHSEETRAMGSKAAETIRERTWRAVTQQFVDVFDRVVDPRT